LRTRSLRRCRSLSAWCVRGATPARSRRHGEPVDRWRGDRLGARVASVRHLRLMMLAPAADRRRGCIGGIHTTLGGQPETSATFLVGGKGTFTVPLSLPIDNLGAVGVLDRDGAGGPPSGGDVPSTTYYLPPPPARGGHTFVAAPTHNNKWSRAHGKQAPYRCPDGYGRHDTRH
jgi:hypothetical protein